MKKIINILLVMLNEADMDSFLKEAMEKQIKGYSLLTSPMLIGEMTLNKKGMGFIQKQPYNIWVPSEFQPKEGIVRYTFKKTERGLVATSISYVTDEEIAKKIWEEILPIAKKEAERLERISFMKKKFNLDKFLGEITPLIKKLNIGEENSYIYNLYLSYEYNNENKIFVHMYDIDYRSNLFDFDVELEGENIFSMDREDITPPLSLLWREVAEEARRREKTKKEKGEEVDNYNNDFEPEVELTEEENNKFINTLFEC